MNHVILTSYNRTDFLEKSINSVLNQTIKNFIVWIIDDGSKKETRDIIHNYSILDDRIRYIQTNKKDSERKKFVDYSNNINMCLKLIENPEDYVFYLVCDDYFFPNHLDLLSKALDKNPSWMVVFGDQKVVRYDDQLKFIRRNPSVVEHASCKIDHIQVGHRKKLIDEIGYWPIDLKFYGHGDAAFWEKINKKYPFYKATGEVTNVNRHHKNSIQGLS
jgi:spore maturation protein CgeD